MKKTTAIWSALIGLPILTVALWIRFFWIFGTDGPRAAMSTFYAPPTLNGLTFLSMLCVMGMVFLAARAMYRWVKKTTQLGSDPPVRQPRMTVGGMMVVALIALLAGGTAFLPYNFAGEIGGPVALDAQDPDDEDGDEDEDEVDCEAIYAGIACVACKEAVDNLKNKRKGRGRGRIIGAAVGVFFSCWECGWELRHCGGEGMGGGCWLGQPDMRPC